MAEMQAPTTQSMGNVPSGYGFGVSYGKRNKVAVFKDTWEGTQVIAQPEVQVNKCCYAPGCCPWKVDIFGGQLVTEQPCCSTVQTVFKQGETEVARTQTGLGCIEACTWCPGGERDIVRTKDAQGNDIYVVRVKKECCDAYGCAGCNNLSCGTCKPECSPVYEFEWPITDARTNAHVGVISHKIKYTLCCCCPENWTQVPVVEGPDADKQGMLSMAWMMYWTFSGQFDVQQSQNGRGR